MTIPLHHRHHHQQHNLKKQNVVNKHQPLNMHRQTKQAAYPLTFSPVRATEQDFVSKLLLADLKDKNKPVKFEFDLRGTAEEPLAEGHRVVRCSARERVEQVFQLKNVTGKGARGKLIESVLRGGCSLQSRGRGVGGGKMGGKVVLYFDRPSRSDPFPSATSS